MIEILYGVILAFIHYFNDDIVIRVHKYRNEIISLGAGVSIAYIFLILFPELYRTGEVNHYVFIFLLFGFTIFHLAEKHIYQQKSKEKILREKKIVHSVAFFVYQFLLGITLYYITLSGFMPGLLFFIPIAFHSIMSNIALTEIHHYIKEKRPYRIILSSSTLLGIIVAEALKITTAGFSLVLSFIIGALVYIVIRDTMPKEQKSKSPYFLLGAGSMLLIIVITGTL